MKAYKGSFKKKNGEFRTMVFSKLPDLPEGFLDNLISGTGAPKALKEGSELVYDLEADGFRVFNWKTAEGPVEELEVDESLF
jgi:hypothetical protein